MNWLRRRRERIRKLRIEREERYGSADLWDREYAEMERRYWQAVRPGDDSVGGSAEAPEGET